MENEDCVRPTTKRELRPQRPPPPAFDPLRTPLQPTRFFQGLATVGGGNLRTMETSVGTHGYRSRAPPGCAALPILLDVVPQLPPGSQVILTTRYDPMRQVMGGGKRINVHFFVKMCNPILELVRTGSVVHFLEKILCV
ncbi:Hypothetical protein NTJ_01169 [Nesidiocoris tenuis]|uniref:Uncharacterized protein n=1 Tax=Nesidiocoris tenuis TaxID=355587 RepID=A0ABN7A7V2_9HEMI|nr:Hypothetical protein NTJ_01169 [Nesidiocoris tenuis]